MTRAILALLETIPSVDLDIKRCTDITALASEWRAIEAFQQRCDGLRKTLLSDPDTRARALAHLAGLQDELSVRQHRLIARVANLPAQNDQDLRAKQELWLSFHNTLPEGASVDPSEDIASSMVSDFRRAWG